VTRRVVTFGEIMLRLSAPGFERLLQSPHLEASFGGSEANVAIALALMGVEASFVTVLPDKHPIADACIGELRRHGVDVSGILRGKGRFGTYYLEAGASQRPPRVRYDRDHSTMALAKPGDIPWDRSLKGAAWFHVSEITPAISASAADLTLEALEKAHGSGLTVTCDLNHRKNLWQWGKKAGEVMPELARHTDVLIGNMETLDEVLGVSGRDPKSVCRAALKKYPNLGSVALTHRKSHSASHHTWSASFFDGKNLLTSRTYEISHIVDRIGAGDAFSAGLICGLSTFPDPEQALEFAAASCVLKHSIAGDFSRSTFSEIEELMKGGGSGKEQR
jgi:2-dehydro-3-deoxygluconokinase